MALLAIQLFLAAALAAATPSLEGTWQGVLDAAGIRLRIVLKLSAAPQGGLRAELDSPDQGASGIPADTVTFHEGRLEFTIERLGAAYKGTLDAEGAVGGEFRQAGYVFPLTFRRETAAARPPRWEKDDWVDPSPHKEETASANGVKLHFLDWGGRGETILLLAGLFSSAHSFDDFAPKLTADFRVLALTRRGHGRSESPASGYDVDTLVEDIRAFLDAMKLDRVVLVGASAGGSEAALFAERHPDRVRSVVYLDSAYDRSPEFAARWAERQARNPLKAAPRPAFAPYEARRSPAALGTWYRGSGRAWSASAEADARAMYVDAEGSVRDNPVAVASVQQLVQSVAMRPPDYGRIKTPTLAFFAVPAEHPNLPAGADEELRRRARTYVEEVMRPMQREQIEQLRKVGPHVRIVEVAGTHGSFLSERQDEVLRELRAFLGAR